MKTNKKKKYIKPKLEVIKISKDQIIVTSGPVSDGNSFGSVKTGYRLF